MVEVEAPTLGENGWDVYMEHQQLCWCLLAIRRTEYKLAIDKANSLVPHSPPSKPPLNAPSTWVGHTTHWKLRITHFLPSHWRQGFGFGVNMEWTALWHWPREFRWMKWECEHVQQHLCPFFAHESSRCLNVCSWPSNSRDTQPLCCSIRNKHGDVHKQLPQVWSQWLYAAIPLTKHHLHVLTQSVHSQDFLPIFDWI